MNQVRPDRMDFWKAKIGVFLFSYKSTPVWSVFTHVASIYANLLEQKKAFA